MDKKHTAILPVILTMLLLFFSLPAAGQENPDSLVPPQGYVAIESVPHTDASDDVLILKETDAWKSPANEQILKDLGVAFSVAKLSGYDEFELNDYKLIIVVSDQPQAFYNKFNEKLAEFEEFVKSGGILVFNGADKGWQSGFWTELPGGVTHKKVYDRTNYVADSAHGIAKGIPETYKGSYASHDHFLDIPAEARLITRDSSGGYTTIEYSMGDGRVIASCVTLEACYGWKWTAGPMLVNIIKYALELTKSGPGQSPAVRVDPNPVETVALNKGKETSRTLMIYNDGGKDLTFSLRTQDGKAMNNALNRLLGNMVPDDVSGSDVPPENYVAEAPLVNINAGDKVLVLKDINAWKSVSNEQILKDLGTDYSVAKSSDFDSLDLSTYKLVIVVSDQPQSFYDAFDRHLADFESFVKAGGTLMFNGADQGWQKGSWKKIPGSVTHKKKYDKTNHVTDPDHPFADGMEVSFTGSYASHGYFENIPQGAAQITRDSQGNYTTIEYSLGSGKVIASGVTLEASYAWGWKGGRILVNAIRRALADVPPPVKWLTADIKSGAVTPGGSKQVQLRYNAAELDPGDYEARIVIESNDPVNSVVKDPATLKVTSGNCPVAEDQKADTCKGKAANITLKATDADNDTLTYAVVKNPSNGTLSGVGPNLKYTPQANYHGTDSFTFKANDGSCDSNTATVTISIENSVLRAEPGAVTKTLAKGDKFTQTLTLSNTGCGTLKYEVSTKEIKSPGANNLVGMSSAPPVVQNIPPEIEYVPGELLVKLAPGASQQGINNLINNVGASIESDISELGIQVWKLPEQGADAEGILLDSISILSEDPNVVYAEPNYILKAIENPDDPKFGDLWGLSNTGQEGCPYDGKGNGINGADTDAIKAWERFRGGSDVVVAVIDTGVDYNHEDLKTNMWMNDDETPGNGKDDDSNGFVDDVYGYDFANNDGDPMDGNGHGTHCSGTIGATGGNGVGITGVNHTVRIMALKFLADNGYGDTANAVKCIIYASDNGAHILSNSWGGGGFSSALKDAITYANDHDVLFVAAAGNHAGDNDAKTYYPSGYDTDNVLSVAATDCQDKIAWFSAWGLTSVDIGAPGVKILSTTPGSKYGYKSGTSMATPHVSGVAALLKGFRPSLTALEIKDLIMNTADPADDLQGKTVTGGRLNAENALAAANAPPPNKWITVTGSLSGEIPAGSSVNLAVALDASGNKIISGDYSANITAVITDDPDNPVQIVVPVSLSVNPDETYTLKIEKQGNGKVKINGAPHDLPWQDQFKEKEQVKIEAAPDVPDWKFSEWLGDYANQGDPINVIIMDKNKNLTARFTNEVFHTLNISVSGKGDVKINGTPCENLPCRKQFKKNSSVTIESAGSFEKWTGDLQGNTNPEQIIMDKDKDITAVFKEFPKNWQTVINAAGEKIGKQSMSYSDWIVNGDENIQVHEYQVTIGVDTKAETTSAPPAPPEYSVKTELYAPDWEGGAFLKDIRKQGEKSYKWILAVNPHGNIPPPGDRTATLSWDPETFYPTGTYALRQGYEGDGSIVVADMRTTTEYKVTGGDQIKYFLIEFNDAAEIKVHLKKGWNMISLPVDPDDPSVKALFPDAEVVYGFEGVYEEADQLEANKGYWIKVPSDRVYEIKGHEIIRRYDVVLEKGWHMIGAPYGKARPKPDEMVEVLYGFDEAYYEAREVEPGKGYWIMIKENEAGEGMLNVDSQLNVDSR